MIRSHDLAALVAIRRMREERARGVLGAAADRVAVDKAAEAAAAQVVSLHDEELGRSEDALLRRLYSDKMPQLDLHAARERLAQANNAGLELAKRLCEARGRVAASKECLDRFRSEWHSATRACDRLEFALADGRVRKAQLRERDEEAECEETCTVSRDFRC